MYDMVHISHTFSPLLSYASVTGRGGIAQSRRRATIRFHLRRRLSTPLAFGGAYSFGGGKGGRGSGNASFSRIPLRVRVLNDPGEWSSSVIRLNSTARVSRSLSVKSIMLPTHIGGTQPRPGARISVTREIGFYSARTRWSFPHDQWLLVGGDQPLQRRRCTTARHPVRRSRMWRVR